MPRILVVEDEVHLADGLRFNLEADGHAVDVEGDGDQALARLVGGEPHYDAVILDVMLPGRDGFAVVHALREAGQYVPVLMLTARARPEDVLKGFEAGADDYLPKPFELQILLARLGGLLRRRQWLQHEKQSEISEDRTANRFSFAGKVIDFERLELQAGGRTIKLTLMEAELLRYLIQRIGKAVPRQAMLTDVWGMREDTDTRAIDNFIVRLRRYLEDDPSAPRHLLTVRGVGYRFVAEPEEGRG
jgi:DNA-binding response OmpR family regulator